MKTHDLIKQAIEILTEAEREAVKDREYVPYAHIRQTQKEAQKALESTLSYQMQVAEELVASWKA